MNRIVIVQPTAKIQISENAVWWSERRSFEEAIRWLIMIEETINSLAENAERHPLARESESFDFNVRQVNAGLSGKRTHRILFSTHDDRVVVYAVRHLAQRDITPDDLI